MLLDLDPFCSVEGGLLYHNLLENPENMLYLEFDYDISGGFEAIDHCGYPLSMIIQGKKLN